MNLVETAQLLAFVARIDNRRVDDATVAAWQAVLDYVPAGDALAAVKQHFANSDDYLKPFHICRFADEADRERRKRAREAREWEAEQTAIARGPVEDRSDEVTALVRKIADNLPGIPADQKHTRALLRARKDHGRPEAKPKKPKRKQPSDWPPPQTDDVAALATRYLLDGHEPKAVAELLLVSRKWCRQTATRFTRTATAHRGDADAHVPATP